MIRNRLSKGGRARSARAHACTSEERARARVHSPSSAAAREPSARSVHRTTSCSEIHVGLRRPFVALREHHSRAMAVRVYEHEHFRRGPSSAWSFSREQGFPRNYARARARAKQDGEAAMTAPMDEGGAGTEQRTETDKGAGGEGNVGLKKERGEREGKRRGPELDDGVLPCGRGNLAALLRVPLARVPSLLAERRERSG